MSFGGLICVVRPGFIFGYEHSTAKEDGSWVSVCSGLLGAIGQAFVFITVRRLKSVHFLVVVHYFMLSSIIGALAFLLFVQRVGSVQLTCAIG